MLQDFKIFFDSLNNNEETATILKYAANAMASLALWCTIALAVGLIVWAIVIRNRDEKYLARARCQMLLIVLCFAEFVVIFIGSLRLIREFVKGDLTWHLWLIVGLIALIVAGVAIVANLQKRKNPAYKHVALGFVIAAAVLTVVLIIVVPPMQEDWGDGYIYTYNAQQPVLMYLFSALLVAVIAVLSLVGEKPGEYNTKSLTYAAICIACAFALSYVKFFSMPQGGSVTFASLLPIALYSYMFGTRKGVVVGIVYGLLQFIQSPQPYQMMQILLDYPIAFGAIGVAGIGRRMKFLKGNIYLEFIVGTTIAVLLRYASHVISGYFVFYTWAGDQAPLAYSLAYNSFTLVDLAIDLVVGALALSSKTLRRTILEANSVGTEQPA